MKIMTAPLSWFRGFFVFLFENFSGNKQDKLHPNEIPWEGFLHRLRPGDARNVNSLVARLGAINEKVPLAVVVVGSTICGKRAYYNDIDLLLLPLHQHNIGLAEHVFVEFAQSQPEVRKKHVGSNNYEEEPVESAQAYSVKRGWYLDFGAGDAPIHLLVIGHDKPSVAHCRITLQQFLQHERDFAADGYKGKMFSIYTFDL